MRRPLAATLLCCGLLQIGTEAIAQPLVQPRTYIKPAFASEGADSGAPDAASFLDGGLILQPYLDSQYAFSSQLLRIGILNREECTPNPDGSQTCTKYYFVKFTVDSNVVDAVTTTVSAVRDYVHSRKGSPLSMTIPFAEYSTKKGTERQTWASIQPFGSFRWVPVSGDNGALSFAGTGGATIDLNIEFDATEPAKSSGDDTTYPGKIYVSLTPSVAVLFGSALKSTVFPGTLESWTSSVECRIGYSFQGKKPVSLGFNGTINVKGFSAAH